jgi:hypothetical protein
LHRITETSAKGKPRHGIRTLPHPPARSVFAFFFSFLPLQSITAGRAISKGLRGSEDLKRVLFFSVFYSFAQRSWWHSEKLSA